MSDRWTLKFSIYDGAWLNGRFFVGGVYTFVIRVHNKAIFQTYSLSMFIDLDRYTPFEARRMFRERYTAAFNGLPNWAGR